MMIIDKDIGYQSFIKRVKGLKGKVLKVGILKDAGNNKDGKSIAEYAIANEYGTKNIPSRSFMRSTANEQKGKWDKMIDKYFKESDLSDQEANSYIMRLGEMIANDIKLKISSNVPPPNAQSTVAKKKSSKTLIDTGLMRSSINYEIE